MTLNTCYCGKESYMAICSKGSLAKISCGKVCTKMLSCSNHYCPQICHKGPCKICSITENQYCTCGKTSRSVSCGHKSEFKCNQKCDFEFDCKIHCCLLDCHDNSAHEFNCPWDPLRIKSCYCGKTALQRACCTDEIRPCAQICELKLPCGHKCLSKCHAGAWYVFKKVDCVVPNAPYKLNYYVDVGKSY